MDANMRQKFGWQERTLGLRQVENVMKTQKTKYEQYLSNGKENWRLEVGFEMEF